MVYFLAYLAVGTAMTIFNYKSGQIEKTKLMALSRGISVDPDSITLGLIVSSLFLWPIFLAAYIADNLK